MGNGLDKVLDVDLLASMSPSDISKLKHTSPLFATLNSIKNSLNLACVFAQNRAFDTDLFPTNFREAVLNPEGRATATRAEAGLSVRSIPYAPGV